ncbi:MAG: hypothetical protein WAO71_09630 [Gallionella sp.]
MSKQNNRGWLISTIAILTISYNAFWLSLKAMLIFKMQWAALLSPFGLLLVSKDILGLVSAIALWQLRPWSRFGYLAWALINIILLYFTSTLHFFVDYILSHSLGEVQLYQWFLVMNIFFLILIFSISSALVFWHFKRLSRVQA